MRILKIAIKKLLGKELTYWESRDLIHFWQDLRLDISFLLIVLCFIILIIIYFR